MKAEGWLDSLTDLSVDELLALAARVQALITERAPWHRPGVVSTEKGRRGQHRNVARDAAVIQMLDMGVSVTAVALHFNVSTTVIYRIIKRNEMEGA